MRTFLRDNGLSLAFLALFLITLFGQSIAGHADTNEQQLQHGAPPIPYAEYIASSDFLVDVAENCGSTPTRC